MQRTDAQEPAGIAPQRGTGAGGVQVAPALPTLAAAVADLPGPDNDHRGAAEGVGDRFKFDLDYVDPRGFRWSGAFAGRVLNLGDKARVGLTKARLAGGVPYSMLDPGTLNLLEMQAHLAIALEVTPPWWKPTELRDGGLLAAVYDEVARREEMFWAPPPKAAGPEARS